MLFVVFHSIFKKINKDYAFPPVNTELSIAVSTDETVIWWDHWEDGYEGDVTAAKQKSTEIWGDHNATNGCAPTIKKEDCTDAIDELNAGDVIVIQNQVELPRDASVVKYDGGDWLQASRPVALTRAAYPRGGKGKVRGRTKTLAGSLMAGAVEVIERAKWGTNFLAPVGQDLGDKYTKGFKFTAFAVQV